MSRSTPPLWLVELIESPQALRALGRSMLTRMALALALGLAIGLLVGAVLFW